MAERVATLKREAFAHSAYVYGTDESPLLDHEVFKSPRGLRWATIELRVQTLIKLRTELSR